MTREFVNGRGSRATLRQLRAFLATAELGSAAAAAKALSVAQPSIGQHLRDLETDLRLRLFERLGTRLAPTSAGLALVISAREVLAAVDRFDQTALRLRSGKGGRIRLGSSATACIHFLPKPLRRTKQLMPEVEIAVVTGNAQEILAGLASGALDVALVSSPPSPGDSSLQFELLFHEPMVALLPHAVAAHAPGPLSAPDLASQPLILFETGGSTRALIDRWFHAAGLLPAPAMELGSVAAIKEMVAAEFGSSIVPGLASPDALDGAVVARPLDPPLSRPLSLALRSSKVLDRSLKLLLEQLREAARVLPLAGGSGTAATRVST